MKKTVVAFAALMASAIGLSACGEAPLGPATLTVNGYAIEQYKIVYAENPETDYLAQYPNYNVVDDIQFNRITAEELRDEIKTLFGAELEVCLDYRTQGSDCEILVGATNRTVDAPSFFAMSPYEMVSGVDGAKVYLCGGSFGATYQAKERLVAYLKAQAEQGGEIDLAEYSLVEEAPLKTVACLGDSITEGASTFIEDVVVDFAENKAHYSWPVVLQRLFWKDCYVYNFGCSGACVRNDLPEHAYVNTVQWSTLLTVAEKVDLALIMLGTNDTFWDSDNTMSTQEAKVFQDSYESILRALLAKNAEMQFTMFNCPVVYGHPFSAKQETLDAQLVAYGEFLAKGYNVEFFDMRTASEQFDRSAFCDGIHLSSRGGGIMAQTVAAALEDLYGMKQS